MIWVILAAVVGAFAGFGLWLVLRGAAINARRAIDADFEPVEEKRGVDLWV